MRTVEGARRRLKEITGSMAWAFACGSPCVVGRRPELDPLVEEVLDLRAFLAEYGR